MATDRSIGRAVPGMRQSLEMMWHLMTRRSWSSLQASLVVVAIGSRLAVASAQPPPTDLPSRPDLSAEALDERKADLYGVDLYGDPMPRGAIARLGSLQVAGEGEPPRGHGSTVQRIAISPDGRLLASRDDDQQIRLWDLQSGKTKFEMQGHQQRILTLAFSPDSRQLASSSWDEVVRLWDTHSGQQISEFPGGGELMRFTDAGQSLTLVRRRSLHRFTVTTGKEEAFHYQRRGVVPLALSPDSRVMAVTTGSTDHHIKLLRVNDQRQLAKCLGCDQSPKTVVFSPDGKLLAAGGVDKIIRVWKTKTGAQLCNLEVDLGDEDSPPWVRQVAFSPDGRILASAELKTDTIRLWEILTGRQITKLTAHVPSPESSPRGNVCALAFAPDGRTFASGGNDRTILVWNLLRCTSTWPKKIASVNAATMGRIWDDLGGNDAAKAYQAIGTLIAVDDDDDDKDRAIRFLASEFEGTLVEADDERILKLIEELGARNFSVREKATMELLKVRAAADALLRKTLRETDSAETRNRIETILRTKIPPSKLSPKDRRRIDRLMVALQQMRSTASLDLLTKLSRHHPDSGTQNLALTAIQRREANQAPKSSP